MKSTRTATDAAKPSRISSGIIGIDTILNSGLVPGRSTLVRGEPGGGKTHTKRDITTLDRCLPNRGITTIIATEVHRITGEFQATEEKISPLADTIGFFRHIEHKGELRKVLGVLKSRSSFEQSLRELESAENGLQIGKSRPELRGILTGTPNWDAESGD